MAPETDKNFNSDRA